MHVGIIIMHICMHLDFCSSMYNVMLEYIKQKFTGTLFNIQYQCYTIKN